MVSGPGGDVWFSAVGPAGLPEIGSVTASGAFAFYPVPGDASTGIVGLAAGPDGNVWFTATEGGLPGGSFVGSMTPSGTVTRYPDPSGGGPAGCPPHEGGGAGRPVRRRIIAGQGARVPGSGAQGDRCEGGRRWLCSGGLPGVMTRVRF
jgi:hypothetical protein